MVPGLKRRPSFCDGIFKYILWKWSVNARLRVLIALVILNQVLWDILVNRYVITR